MPVDQTTQTLTARWIFPADGPPLPGGTITIQDDKIVAVEPSGTRTADEDLGNVAILPGLVNAHTHLDLSDARGKIPPTPDFTAWLSGVIRHRGGQTSYQVQQAVANGVTEAASRGTTLIGDVCAGAIPTIAFGWAPVRGTVFHEMLGLTEEGAKRALQTAQLAIIILTSRQNCRAGLSPHAPYSFRADSLARVAEFGTVVSIHLAESSAECELMARQTGPFVPFLAEMKVWDPSGLARSPRHVVELTSNAKRVLYIHCNYLAPDTPIPSHATIVYCPRTHAAFGHPPHPFREFMKRGVRVVLGTDSLASNPDLDILAEARFVHARHADLPGETLLRMITLDGAIALGWGDVAGSLTPAKSADLVALPLPDRDEPDPYRLVFDSALAVQRTMFRGQWRG